MQYRVTIKIAELGVQAGPYLVEAADEWKARTRAMGVYLNSGEVHPGFTGSFVDYEVAEALPLFSGDWEWSDVLEAWEVAYPAVRYGKPWNGWATPVVTRRTLVALVARNEFMRAAEMPDLDRMEWQGNSVLVLPFDVPPTDPQAKDALKVLMPAEDGTYDLGVLGYTLVQVQDNERVLRAVRPTPTREQCTAPCEWCGEAGSDREDGPVYRYDDGDFHAGCWTSHREHVTAQAN